MYIPLWMMLLQIHAVLGKNRESQPNIIFILADDLGWNDVSFHGSPQIPTPNLDYLAFDGIKLNNYYVQPLCTPSRAALMTGLYPIHTGLQHYVITPTMPVGLPLNFTLLPQHLKNIGYATHAIGKWHLGFFHPAYLPTSRGFESHYGFWTGAEDYYFHTTREDNTSLGYDFRHNLKPAFCEVGTYSTETFTRQALDIINNHNKTKPLFLYIAHQAVHTSAGFEPLQVPRRYSEKFNYIQDPKRRLFAGMVAAIDDSVGEIIKGLQTRRMLRNSIIIFSSDNGGPPQGMGGNVASNWPLRGAKTSLWEGGVRGAALIWSPRLKCARRVSHQLLHITDWLPTLYYVAGGDTAELGSIDGLNVWNALSENLPSPRQEVLLNIDPIWKMKALRVGRYKMTIGDYDNGHWSKWYGPVGSNDTSDYDIQCKNRSFTKDSCNVLEEPCLFDIGRDPCEYHNIAKSKPQILKYLVARLQKYETTMVPPLMRASDPMADPFYHGYVWSPWRKSPSM